MKKEEFTNEMAITILTAELSATQAMEPERLTLIYSLEKAIEALKERA